MTLKYIPIHPVEWRKQVNKILESQTISDLAQKLALTVDQLQNRLRDDLPERDHLEWKALLKRCVSANSNFSVASIAKILGIEYSEFCRLLA